VQPQLSPRFVCNSTWCSSATQVLVLDTKLPFLSASIRPTDGPAKLPEAVTYAFANTMASRKRRAPGASPIENTYQDPSNTVTDTFMNNYNDPLSTDMGAFGDPSFYEGLNFAGNMGQPSTHNRVVSLDESEPTTRHKRPKCLGSIRQPRPWRSLGST
jgi:hypothetical protein